MPDVLGGGLCCTDALGGGEGNSGFERACRW